VAGLALVDVAKADDLNHLVIDELAEIALPHAAASNLEEAQLRVLIEPAREERRRGRRSDLLRESDSDRSGERGENELASGKAHGPHSTKNPRGFRGGLRCGQKNN
jgi:hypothetical protein